MRIREHLVGLTCTLLGLIVFIVVFGLLHLQHRAETGTQVRATVTEVTPHDVQVQCGSVQSGSVSIPIYCPDTMYYTSFAVEDTNTVIDLDSSHPEGETMMLWHIEDQNHHLRYDVIGPHSTEQLVWDFVWGLLAALLSALVMFAVAVLFFD